MNASIRRMNETDREQILKMMREFYASDMVFTDGSEEIYNADIDNCIGECPFVEGYVFDDGNNIQGYAMVAKSFSTEFGKQCVWIEDIYIKNEFRGIGIGSSFLRYVEEKYPDSIFRLEVENHNERAVNVYKKCGYTVLPYMEMKK